MHTKVVWIFMATSLLVALLVPIYTIQYQYPAFTQLVKESVHNEASRVALNLSAMLVADSTALRRESLPAGLRRQVDGLAADPRFVKIRLFSPAGEILHSTQPGEVGQRNQEGYFQRIVATGAPRSVEVPKGTDSLERERAPADVVETYVPLTRQGQLVGILEIYYDITAENAQLRHLLTRSSSTLFALMLGLVGLVVASALMAHRSLQARRRVEAEREALIGQLQEALANVKTLTGLLPMCAWCKKIREDTGYYTSVEQYLETHLDATVTHGICQECALMLRAEIARPPDTLGVPPPPANPPASA